MSNRFARAIIPAALLAGIAAALSAEPLSCCAPGAEPAPCVAGWCTGVAGPPAQESHWRRWGGPHGDFTVDVTGLADSWPAAGPHVVWRRDLGSGYSAIVVDDGRLFTMYRRRGSEVVIAMDAVDGATLWEYDYSVRLGDFDTAQGAGPHSSPLVYGDRLFTVGFTGEFHAFDKRTGEVLWSVNLWDDLGGTIRPRGYSSSPIEYGGAIILPVGGRGQAVVGFDPEDGSIVWRGGDFDNAHATPIIIDVDGQPQLVALMVDYVAGFDPASGAMLWRHPHRTDYGLNISTPIWGDDNLLFISSAYSGGSRALRLTLENGVTRVEELWFTNQMRVHFGTAIRIGDHLFGANGDFGPSFVTAVDMTDGSILWRDRTFAKASFLLADGKLIVLDEDGVLGLAVVSPAGMQVVARADVFDSRAWTVPTLAGTVLFARDLEEILAIDLSVAANAEK